MNRLQLILGMLIVSYLAPGQETVKVYEYAAMWHSAELKLFGSQFIWRDQDCLGKRLVSGRYTITNKRIQLLPENSLAFRSGDYEDLIEQGVIDSCCNVFMAYTGATTRTDSLALSQEFRSKVDSCLLSNMTCILSSSKIHWYRRQKGFDAKFAWTDFRIRGERLVLMENDRKSQVVLENRK